MVDQREMLVAQVNHRARNSLAIAASLIGLQARRQLDENVKALFAETQERLVAMARVHGLLSKSETLQLIDPVELHPGSLRGAPSDRRY